MFAIRNCIKISVLSRIIKAEPSGALNSKHGISCGKGIYDSPLDAKKVNKVNVKRNYLRIPCKKYMDVNCKTALITSGSTGIGFAIADALLAAGLKKAYLSGVNYCEGMNAVLDMTIKHGAGRCDYLTIDANRHGDFEDAFRYIIWKEGSLDILVNNAGLLNDKHWELEFDTNVKGVVRGSLLANKYMPRQKNRGGCVVNITSVHGFDNCPYSPGYSSSKHAAVGFTKSFGDPKKFKLTGVRHIAVGPGATKTQMIHCANNLLDDDWCKKVYRCSHCVPVQDADAVGRGTVYPIEYGPPGSLWVIENHQLQRVIPPKKESYQIKVKDL